ncbi:uncharacterized protein EI90DRAFT_3043195 [Cantharellus anzutake]|uniref:uncharacterized protein n=1 Tax=Cantharellus anzutake TaxID=1750568 RepID=UPI001904BF0A|nr:uncharacterized protein EI90DRAFT_3043195 [Cantharellus anzutake]KAF8337503.1 hypothetical protein EI90DRAFT_3043195 [Cantharellus anzutake]
MSNVRHHSKFRILLKSPIRPGSHNWPNRTLIGRTRLEKCFAPPGGGILSWWSSINFGVTVHTAVLVPGLGHQTRP